MKKIGSLEFFQDVDLNLKFDFNELAEFHGADELGIKEKLLDESENQLIPPYQTALAPRKFSAQS